VRETDTAARLGGDEFGVVLPRVHDRDGMLQSLRRVQDSIHAPFEYGGNTYALAASLGTALFPEDGAEIEALVNTADMAMYIAKRQRKEAPK